MTMFEKRAHEIIAILKAVSAKLDELRVAHEKAARDKVP